MKNKLSISASAGSGKTHQLALRYIYLLFMGQNAQEILCLTFTNKAKSEMHTRILNTLQDLKNNQLDKKSTKNLIKDLRDNLAHENIKLTQQLAQKVYDNFIYAKHYIVTFDSFFNTILRKFSFYEGIFSNYEISNMNFSSEGFEKLLENTRNLDSLAGFCAQFDMDSKGVLKLLDNLKSTNIDEIKLDSNFKENLCAKINAIFSDGFKFFEGKKGAKNLLKRFDNQVDVEMSDKEFFEIVEQLNLTDKMIETLEKSDYRLIFEQNLDEAKKLLCEYFNARESQVLRQMQDILENYKHYKKEILLRKNKLSFSDVSEFCHSLLRNFDRDFFYFQLDSKIKHILVDEFQDTSRLQYAILEPLFKEIASGIGRAENRSLFFVGDEKQAIYGWREGDSRLVRAIPKDLQFENNHYETLDMNYRSTKNIIHFVNEIFKDKFEGYKIQTPHSQDCGYVEVVSTEAENVLDKILERVKFLCDNGSSNIAILVRKNSQAQEIYWHLRENAINDISITVDEATNKEFLIIKNALLYARSNKKLYLKNCLKINGEKYNGDDFKPLSLNPSNLVLEIIQRFKLYGNMALMILQNATKYDDLDEFLSFLENEKNSASEAPKSKIKIMTIHKSKGLEFSDVICCELKSKKNNTPKPFYFDYKGLELQKIWYLNNKKEREFVDDKFKAMLDTKNEFEKSEDKNLLYVAFTRAKNSLFIIKLNQSILFSELNLKDCQIGRNEVKNENQNEKAKISAPPAILGNLEKSFGKQSEFLSQNMDINISQIAQIKGFALHLVLEYRLKYGIDSSLDSILQNRFGLILDKKARDEIIKNANKILENSIIKSLLDSAISVQCEVSFLVGNEIKRIDCLIETSDGYVVLDYKSSDLNFEIKKAQICQYLDFVRKIKPNSRAYLCFASGEIRQVG